VDGPEVVKDIRGVSALPSHGGVYLGAGKNLEAGGLWSGGLMMSASIRLRSGQVLQPGGDAVSDLAQG
jgi:hypothetical protein